VQSQWLLALRGYATIELRGSGPEAIEALINAAVDRKMTIWDIRIKQRQVAELKIVIADFFRLKPLLKETGCRIRVKERHGLPFMMDRLGSRQLFVAGLICFVAGLYLLSAVIWQVKVEGNDKLTATEVLEAARAEGIRTMQWKFKLKETDELSRGLHSRLPGTSWVGVEVKGTQLIIKIVESKQPEQKELQSPRHLVATHNAVITQIFADKGKPMVKPNSVVRKGDVLISGVIGDEVHQQTVVANGKVKGLVWYTANVEVPLTQMHKVYTGETQRRDYLLIGGRALKLYGYRQQDFEREEIIEDRKTLHFRNYALPFGWLKERRMQVSEQEQALDQAAARSLGLERAKADLLMEAGAEARVVDQKILHEKTENGKVYMETLFEVEQYIMEEKAIVQQGE